MLYLTFSFIGTALLTAQESKDASAPLGRAHLLEKVQLTEVQKRDFEKLQFGLANQAFARQANVRTAMVELCQPQKAESPDKTALKKINERADLQNLRKTIRLTIGLQSTKY